MNILVVEDSPLIARKLERFLHRMHHDVAIVESAEEALEYLEGQAVSLLLLDQSLPGMDGLDLVKELRTGEKYRYLPIIMVTGHKEQKEVVRALQAGVDEYLVKPVMYEVFEEKIKHLLGFRIRQAGPEDAETLAQLIVELADEEKHKAAPDVAALRRHLALTANPGCTALLAEHKGTGKVIGFALYFHTYSTFLTRWGLYFEDLYVRPAFRGRGASLLLLKRMAEIALESGYNRLDFSVLSWNRLTISRYRELGAQDLPHRKGMRLSGKALRKPGESG